MIKFDNCIILILIESIFFVITYFLMALQKKKLFRNFESETKKATIVNNILDILIDLDSEKKELKNYPNISIYLHQFDKMLYNNCFDIFDVEISTLDKAPEITEYGLKKTDFLTEYMVSSDSVKSMIDDFSNNLGVIFELKHPIKYSYFVIKKNIVLRIIEYFIKMDIKTENKRFKKKEKQPITYESKGILCFT